MKCNITFNCGSVEQATCTKDFKWDTGEHGTHTDTLDFITWCDIGNIKISFDNEEDREFFIGQLKEDIINYTYYLRKGKEFLRGLTK